MARDVESLVVYCRSLFCEQTYSQDMLAVPLPFNDDVSDFMDLF